MKKLFFVVAGIVLSNAFAFSQSEMDLLRVSRNQLTGTARSIGMGGAFGALGGDISAVAINPAGIGVYQSSEIVSTLSFRSTKNKTESASDKMDESKFRVGFDNFGVVGAFPIGDENIPFFNFGFTYNRLKSFRRNVNMKDQFISRSMADHIADRTNGYLPSELSIESDPFNRGVDWLSALGYNTGLIAPLNANSSEYQSFVKSKGLVGASGDNQLYLKEKGYIDSYDFNMGTTISDMLSIGLTVSVTDMDYRLYSDYREDTYHQVGGQEEFYGNFFLSNWLHTEGTGWQVKAGLIFKPIHELRIGVAYHSPTWYEMTDYYSATMDAFGKFIDTFDDAGNTYYDYKLKTPDKWVFSLAGVIGQNAIVSVDYELTNYKNGMRFRDAGFNSDFEAQNSFVKTDFRNASTLRVGAEYRFTPRVTGRVGYAWMQSPLQAHFKDGETVPRTAGTVTHYVLEGDSHNFTWGAGYKFNPNSYKNYFYTDIAFVVNSQKDFLYAFEDSDRVKLNTSIFSGLITLGYKF